MVGAKPLANLQAVDSRHLNIQKQKVNWFFLKRIQSLH